MNYPRNVVLLGICAGVLAYPRAQGQGSMMATPQSAAAARSN